MASTLSPPQGKKFRDGGRFSYCLSGSNKIGRQFTAHEVKWRESVQCSTARASHVRKASIPGFLLKASCPHSPIRVADLGHKESQRSSSCHYQLGVLRQKWHYMTSWLTAVRVTWQATSRKMLRYLIYIVPHAVTNLLPLWLTGLPQYSTVQESICTTLRHPATSYSSGTWSVASSF